MISYSESYIYKSAQGWEVCEVRHEPILELQEQGIDWALINYTTGEFSWYQNLDTARLHAELLQNLHKDYALESTCAENPLTLVRNGKITKGRFAGLQADYSPEGELGVYLFERWVAVDGN
jgi:hypothetical protein